MRRASLLTLMPVMETSSPQRRCQPAVGVDDTGRQFAMLAKKAQRTKRKLAPARAREGRIAFMEWWWESSSAKRPRRVGVFPRWFIVADDLGLRELAQRIQRLRRKMRLSLSKNVHPHAGFECESGLFDAYHDEPKKGVKGHRIRLTIVGYTPRQLAEVESKFGRANPNDTAEQIWMGIHTEARRQQEILRKCRADPVGRPLSKRGRLTK